MAAEVDSPTHHAAAVVYCMAKCAHSFGRAGELYLHTLARASLGEGLELLCTAGELRGAFLPVIQRERSFQDFAGWFRDQVQPVAPAHSHSSELIGGAPPAEEDVG